MVAPLRWAAQSSARCWRCSLLHAEYVGVGRPVDGGALGRAPPATAPKMVQLYVSQLRKLIEGDEGEIVTRGRGYVLRVAAELDAPRFERLVGEAARAEGTSNSLAREALALWRGPAARRPRRRAVRQAESRPPRGAAARARRGAASRPSSRAAGTPRSLGELECARRRAPAARAPARAADARPLPLGAPGRGARGLPATRAARSSRSSGSSPAASSASFTRRSSRRTRDSTRRAEPAPAAETPSRRVRRSRARARRARRRSR